MKKSFALVLAVLALVASACSFTREDGIADLVEAGMSEEAAACTMDKFIAAGFEPQDATGTPEADAQAAFTDATLECSSGDDLAGLIEGEGLDARQEFIDGMTGDGTITEEQANCIVDGMEAEGVSVTDFAVDTEAPASQAALEAAIAACI